jgi:TolA-binding protein
MRALALEGKGYAYEGKGDLDQAIAAFDALSQQNKSDFLTGMGPYHHARILVEQKKLNDAAVAFQDVQTKYPASSAARLAGDRLTLLAAQGVKPPPAPVLAVTPAKDAG